MTGLIIATHGDLAASALEAAELLVGEQEQVETIGFRPGDSLELLLERFTQAIKRLEECEEILVLTDIKGGSPCNAATVMKAKNPKLRVVAGLSKRRDSCRFHRRAYRDRQVLHPRNNIIKRRGAFTNGKNRTCQNR